MFSSLTKILLAASPEKALGVSAFVHVAVLAVMAVWTIGRVAEPPQFGGKNLGLCLEINLADLEPEVPAVMIAATDLPPSAQPPDPEPTDQRLAKTATLPPPRDDPVAVVEELLAEPVLVRPRPVRREQSASDIREARVASPTVVPRRVTTQPKLPTPIVSHERLPPDFSGRMPVIYPEEARRMGFEGRVLLRLSINAEGRVTRTEIIESSGHKILDEAATRAVRTWQGKPAHVGGRPVASVEVLPIRFRLR
jgi:protein TonB